MVAWWLQSSYTAFQRLELKLLQHPCLCYWLG